MRAVLIVIIIFLSALVVWLSANRWQSVPWTRLVTWGSPQVVESFADNKWRERWAIFKGDFAVRDSRLITTGGNESMTLYRQQMGGPVAIEFTGSMEPGSPPCDLSVVWCNDVHYDVRGNVESAKIVYKLQVGAYDNGAACIVGPNGEYLAYKTYALNPIESTRFRYELADTSLRILVNGAELISCELPIPIAAGWVGIYGHYAGKAFDDVAIYRQQIEESVSVTAVGDYLAQRGQYAEAAAEYARISHTLPAGPLVDRAKWLHAVCIERAQPADAQRAWAALNGTSYEAYAQLAQLRERFTVGDYQSVSDGLSKIYAGASPSMRAYISGVWIQWVSDLHAEKAPYAVMLHFAELQGQVLMAEEMTHRSAADLWLTLRQPQIILNRFPNLRHARAAALLQLGRAETVVAEYKDQPVPWISALRILGRGDDIIASGIPWAIAQGLIVDNRYDDLCVEYPDNKVAQALVLQRLGRFQEVIDNHSEFFGIYIDSLLALGRVDEAVAFAEEHPSQDWQIAMRLGHVDQMWDIRPSDLNNFYFAAWAVRFADWGVGREDRKDEYESLPVLPWWDTDSHAFYQTVLVPAQLALTAGTPATLTITQSAVNCDASVKAMVADWQAILDTGTADPDEETNDKHLVLHALHFDLAGDVKAARAGYVAFLAKRHVGSDVPARFAEARLLLLPLSDQ